MTLLMNFFDGHITLARNINPIFWMKKTKTFSWDLVEDTQSTSKRR
jgi:hypothetical protein